MASRPPPAPTRSRRLATPSSTITTTPSIRKASATPATRTKATPSSSASSTLDSNTTERKRDARSTTKSSSPDDDELARMTDRTLHLGETNKAFSNAAVPQRTVVTSRTLMQASTSTVKFPSRNPASRVKVASSSSSPSPSPSSGASLSDMSAKASQTSRQTTTTTASDTSSTLPPAEMAKAAMKTINSCLQSLSALVKSRASFASVNPTPSSSNTTVASGSESSRTTAPPPLRKTASSSSLRFSSIAREATSIAKPCSTALMQLRGLVRKRQIEKRTIEVEKAAMSFVGYLVELEQYRHALGELEAVKSSILTDNLSEANPPDPHGTASTSTSIVTRSLDSFAHLIAIPLPASSPTTPGRATPDEIVPLVLAIHQYAIGCLFRSEMDLKASKSRAHAVALSLCDVGNPMAWRSWWEEERDKDGDAAIGKRVDAMLTSMFGSLTKGCVGSDAHIDLHNLLSIRSRALLLYTTTSSVACSSEKLSAVFDQARKIILSFGRQAELMAISPKEINEPIQKVFQELIDTLHSIHPGLEPSGSQWLGLCEVILHIAKRADDLVAIERTMFLLEDEKAASSSGEEEVEKQAEKALVKLMSIISSLEVSSTSSGKEKDGKGLEQLKRISTFVAVLNKLAKRGNGLKEATMTSLEKTFEKLRLLVVRRIKKDQRYDALVVGPGSPIPQQSDVDQELRRLCEALATRSEDSKGLVSTPTSTTSKSTRDNQERLLSSGVDSFILLAHSSLVMDDRTTYSTCFRFLERALSLVGLSIEGGAVESVKLEQAYWVRSLASVYYNISGMLFNANHPESTIRFVRRACEITKAVLSASTASDDSLATEMGTLSLDSEPTKMNSRSERETAERHDLLVDCRKYATKRFELLALAYHTIGDKANAVTSYTEALTFLTEEARADTQLVASVTDLIENKSTMATCKLVQRITKLATFDLLWEGSKVSLLQALQSAKSEQSFVASVIEIQLQTLDVMMDKNEAVKVSAYLVDDLLQLYTADRYPLRRARLLLRRMQSLCAGDVAQNDLTAAAVAAEIESLCETSSLGEDTMFKPFKLQYLASSHLWLAFYAHQARQPSTCCFDEARTALLHFRKILEVDNHDLRSSTSRTPKKSQKQHTPSPKIADLRSERPLTTSRRRPLTSTALATQPAAKAKAGINAVPKTPRIRGRAIPSSQITPPRVPLVDLSNAPSRTTPASKSKREVDSHTFQEVLFDDIEAMCHSIEMMASLLGALGHPLLRIGYLKLLQRLAPRRPKRSDEAYTISIIRLAHETAQIGRVARALTLFSQAEARVEAALISAATRVDFYLLHAEALALAGKQAESSDAYQAALDLSGQLDDDDAGAATSARIAHRTALLNRVALAASVCSTMLQRRGDLGRCLAPALQAMRLSNRALANITRLSKAETVGSGPKDDLAFTSDRTDSNAPLADNPPQAQHTTPAATTGPYVGLLYAVANGLCSTVLRVASLYWIRGTPKSADFYATHAHAIATQYGSGRLIARSLLLRCEVRLHLGDLLGAEEDLRAVEEEATSDASIESVEYHRLSAVLHMRRRSVEGAKKDHSMAQTTLELLVSKVGDNEIGGTPMKLADHRSTSMKDLSPSALRLSIGKPHSPHSTVLSPSSQRSNSSVDRILPATHSQLLRMHIGLLRAEGKQDKCQDLLRRLSQLPTLEEDKSEELRLQIMIKMQDLLARLSTDAVLGMLPESALSMPSLASTSASLVSKSATPMKTPNFVHALREIETLLQMAIGMSVSRTRPAVLRELSLLSVSLRALQTSTGQAVPNSATRTAHLLDLGLAVTLRRDMLEAIDYRIATSTRVDDLRWPSLDMPQMDARSSSTTQLIASRERYRAEVAEPALTDASLSSILPLHWTTVSIHVTPDRDSLILVRHRYKREPLVFKLPFDRIARREDEESGLGFAQVIGELNDIIARSNLGTQNAKNVEGKEGRIAWWSERKELDDRLKALVEAVEDSWLGAFKSIFLDSSEIEDQALGIFKSRIERVLKRSLVRTTTGDRKPTRLKIDDSILECFATLPPKARDEDLEDLYYFIMESFQLSGIPVACDETDVDQVVIDLRSALEELRNVNPIPASSHPDHHLVLVLDKTVQSFPWEALPCLKNLSISRIPSLAFLRDRLEHAREHARSVSGDASHRLVINPTRTSFIVNPGGDLKNTQAKFQPWLESKKVNGWSGLLGRAPSEEEFKIYLASKELVLYFGHGGAEQYIRSQTIRHLPRCAVTMLWGCSSGLLRDQGDFDPYGTPYHYMIAGCPSLVANLWDVTDKDIDALTENVFKLTGLKQTDANDSIPGGMGRSPSLSQAISQSRKICNLRYLNGAAVVNYGIPVWFST